MNGSGVRGTSCETSCEASRWGVDEVDRVKRGGAMPGYQPTGWAYLSVGCTIRWQRGDIEAYVLKGNTVGGWGMEGVLGRIPVSAGGWADLAEVRGVGERGVRRGVRIGDITDLSSWSSSRTWHAQRTGGHSRIRFLKDTRKSSRIEFEIADLKGTGRHFF